jgi:hypothetical protein
MGARRSFESRLGARDRLLKILFLVYFFACQFGFLANKTTKLGRKIGR